MSFISITTPTRVIHETHNVTREVHEHRAPTDESVRLLREMEDAARKHVESAFRLENCAVDCVVYRQSSYTTLYTEFRGFFTINGKRHTFEYTYRGDRLGFDDRISPEIACGLRDALATAIAIVILPPALTEMTQR